MTGKLLKTLLEGAEWPRSSAERDHQEYLAEWLSAHGVPFEREVGLSQRDRIDFLVHGTVGIELKVSACAAGVLRQLMRYAASPRVEELLLLSFRRSVLAQLPGTLQGKPLFGLCIGRAAL